ncbi:VOC family protein [Sinomonas sp. G460-2]|uniref:VOC family protein n=1 Tax=Sinomonas sp. G460-2 TaxID=3393464 RepID=UPI0039EEE2E1
MHISSVAFDSGDLARAESFYGSVLGLPTIHDDGALTIRAGSSLLTLREGPIGPGRQHLAFTIPRLLFDGAKQWAIDRVRLLCDDEGKDEFEASSHWNARSLYFEDPDGNILEFIIRRDIVDNRGGQFRPERIQSISEIGVAAEDVPGTTSQVESVLGITGYGGGASAFQPVGDLEGLLILVAPGRHWFPTKTPNAAGRLTVHIAGRSAGTIRPSPGTVIHSSIQESG